jgi:biotin synthase
MSYHKIIELYEYILQGRAIHYDDAIALTRTKKEDVPLLAGFANKIRQRFAGETVDMCGILNARSGMCSEDCKFCAQSVHHRTEIAKYGLLNTNTLLSSAQKAMKEGAQRISIVTSGKGMNTDPDFPDILQAIQAVIRETGLEVCANLGTLTPLQAQALADIGVKRYAHNLETSKSFYPKVCTTHSYEDRLKTLQAVKAAGMELCCGGIIGMGESWEDRISLAFALKELNADSVPLNILNPIKGTALEAVIPPSALDIIKTFAIFRFILPDKVIRPAGGRELNLRDLQGALMLAGANGLIIGNYLTFSGRDAAADFRMVQDAGLTPSGILQLQDQTGGTHDEL